MSKTKTEDGNRQDMSVHDKEHPSLAATEEAQDVASLNRIVVGMPAYTDPHNPMTLSGSVNLPLDQHPVTHSEDYGDDVAPGQFTFDPEGNGGQSPMAVGAKSLLSEADTDDTPQFSSEDRAEWSKADWQKAARYYELPTSGNIDTIKNRVEEHEANAEAIDARSKELHAMSREELDALAPEYNIDPADHAHKPDLADAILEAESNQD
jgi:hypothetical protein